MSRRPSFQFYPADWRNDAALRMCSLAARGLWWEMLCIMHMSEPYGHLTAAGAPIEPDELARIVGETAKDVRRWMAELERRKVFSVTPDGVIFSRRMVRDESERGKWRERQARHRVVTPTVTVDVTPVSPRSSSSPSSSSSEELEHANEEVDLEFDEGTKFLDRRPRSAPTSSKNGGNPPAPFQKLKETAVAASAPEPQRRQRKTPLPEGFPDADAIMRAIKFFNENDAAHLAHDVRNQAELFRAHHEAKATLSANWAASWRTWIGRAPGFTPKDRTNGTRRSAHDNFLAGGAAFIAKLEDAERESEGDNGDVGATGPRLLPGGLRSGTG